MSRNVVSHYDRYLKFNPESGYKISSVRSVWIPDADEGYVRGFVESESGGKLKLKLGDGGFKTLDSKKVEPANPGKFDGVADCAELSHLNDATVFQNLKVRYTEDLIHTSSGLFLVVINPYKWIPIYTPEIIEKYRGKRRNEVHPHVFAIADEAYRAMLVNKQNQSMLITGESGAGKTENTKKVIQYLATIAGKADGDLERQILQANPMLEAFGNAKTNKNDNSSRFGKFIRVQFNDAGIICGSTIQVYLLEKSRVVHQGRNERNFHIFYQILAGANEAQRKTYHTLKPHQYGFFTDKDAIRCKSMEDDKEWEATLEAMEVVGLNGSEQDSIFRIISGIMHCGNIKFESSYGSEGAKIAAGDSTTIVSELWGMDEEQFKKAIIRPRIKAGLETVEKHLSVEQASYSIKAMCKSVYERLFLWLIKKLNSVLASNTETNFIGVLDIAGFEIFELNSFEQLCINFTNEKLQQFFNDHMFKLEQEEYAREKIEWKYVDFGVDSQMTIDLIEKKPHSIMSLLDEESIFPRASNKTLITKLHTLEKKSPKYGTVQFKELNFKIAHYAGDVVYDVTGWIDKNKDPLQDDIAKSITDSKRPFVANLFKDADLDARAAIAARIAAAAGGKKKSQSGSGASFMTVAATYQEQLGDLMTTLRATEPSFIRCIIPNLQKRPGRLAADLVLEQLRCNGVLEGIRISRMGFPNRIVYAQFLRRYYLLHPTLKRDDPESKAGTEKIMAHLDKEIKGYFVGDNARDAPLYQLGLTKIFFRHGVLAFLEEKREAKLSKMVVQIQSASRGWIGRNAYKKVNMQGSAARTIQKNVATWLKFKNWIWWRMFVASKPLLHSVGLDVMIADTEANLERLQAAMKDLGADMDKLTKEREQKQAELERLRAEQAEAAERERAMNDSVSQLSRDVEGVNKEIEEQEEYLRKLRLGNSATDGDLAAAEDELKEKEDALVQCEKDLVAMTDETKDQVEKLSDLGRRVNELEAENDKRKAEQARLEAEIAERSRELSQAEDKCTRLKGELDDLEGQIGTIEEEQDSLSRTRSALGSGNADHEATLSERSADLSATKDENSSLRSANKSLAGNLEDTQLSLDRQKRENSDASSKKKRLGSEMEDTVASADDQEAAKNKQEKENKELAEQITTLTDEVDSLSSEVRDAQKQKSEQTNKLAELRAQLESLQSQIEKLKKRISELEAELTATEDKLDAESVARGGVEKAVKALEAQLREAQEELEDAESAASKAHKQGTKLEKDIKDAQDRLEAAQDANKRLDSDTKEKRGRLTGIQDEVDAATRKADGLKKDAAKLEEQAASVKSEADEEAEARDRAERGAKSAQASLKAAEADLARLEEESSAASDKLRAKKQELEEAKAKAAQAGAAEERRAAAREAKQTQSQLNEVLDNIAKAEAAAKSGARRKARLERQVAEMKADAERAANKIADAKKRRAAAEDAQQALKKEASDLERANKKQEADMTDVRKQLKALRDAVRKAVKVSNEGKVDKAKSVFLVRAQSITASRSSSRPSNSPARDSSREADRLSRYSRRDD